MLYTRKRWQEPITSFGLRRWSILMQTVSKVYRLENALFLVQPSENYRFGKFNRVCTGCKDGWEGEPMRTLFSIISAWRTGIKIYAYTNAFVWTGVCERNDFARFVFSRMKTKTFENGLLSTGPCLVPRRSLLAHSIWRKIHDVTEWPSPRKSPVLHHARRSQALSRTLGSKARGGERLRTRPDGAIMLT